MHQHDLSIKVPPPNRYFPSGRQVQCPGKRPTLKASIAVFLTTLKSVFPVPRMGSLSTTKKTTF